MTQNDADSPANFSPFPPTDPVVAESTTAPPVAPNRSDSAPKQPPSKTWLHRVTAITGGGSLFAVITACITLIGGIAGLIFLFWPSLRPDDPPSAMGAQLSNPRVEQGVTLGAYWDRRRDFILQKNPQSTEPTGDARSIEGAVVTFQVVIEGYANQQNLVQWTMIDPATGGRLANYPAMADAPGWPEKYIVPTVNSDQNTIELWIEIPPEPGTYAIVIDLFDPKGIRLASLQTDPFVRQPRATPTRSPHPTEVATAGSGSGQGGGGGSGGSIPTLAPIGNDGD